MGQIWDITNYSIDLSYIVEEGEVLWDLGGGQLSNL